MIFISVLFLTSLGISQCSAALVKDKKLYAPLINKGESEPSCAQGRNYCEHVENYPKETIMKLLQRFESVPRELSDLIFDNDEFGLDTGEYEEKSEYFQGNASLKHGYDKEKHLCEAMPLRIRPRAAKNHKDEWLYIVNVDGYSQILYTEICQDSGENCASKVLPNNIRRKSNCQQEHIKVELLALDTSGKNLVPHSNIVNSCCKCKLL